MFNSNATTINEQMSFYSTLSIILMVIGIVLFVAAVVMWFAFKIPHAFRVLTGAGVGKEIRQLSSATKTGAGYVDNNKNKAVISWNTSAHLGRNPQDEETQLLENNNVFSTSNPAANLVDNEITTVLGAQMDSEATVVLGNLDFDPDATMVLDDTMNGYSNNKRQMPEGFEIEDEIIITGNDIKRK